MVWAQAPSCPHLSSVAEPLHNRASISQTPAVWSFLKATWYCTQSQGPFTMIRSSCQPSASPSSTKGQGLMDIWRVLCLPGPSLFRGGHPAQKLQRHQEWVQGADPSCLPGGCCFTGPSILRGLGGCLVGILLPPRARLTILSPRPQVPTAGVRLGGCQASICVQHMLSQGCTGQVRQLLRKCPEQVKDHS